MSAFIAPTDRGHSIARTPEETEKLQPDNAEMTAEGCPRTEEALLRRVTLEPETVPGEIGAEVENTPAGCGVR